MSDKTPGPPTSPVLATATVPESVFLSLAVYGPEVHDAPDPRVEIAETRWRQSNCGGSEGSCRFCFCEPQTKPASVSEVTTKTVEKAVPLTPDEEALRMFCTLLAQHQYEHLESADFITGVRLYQRLGINRDKSYKLRRGSCCGVSPSTVVTSCASVSCVGVREKLDPKEPNSPSSSSAVTPETTTSSSAPSATSPSEPPDSDVPPHPPGLGSESTAVPNPKQPIPPATLVLWHRMMLHAQMAYGGLMRMGGVLLDFDVSVLADRLKLCKDCFVHWNSSGFHGKTYLPAHYICLEHRFKSIVVAIRGTLSLGDLMTDIAALPAKLDLKQELDGKSITVSGLVHSGVMTSAQNILASVRTKLAELCTQYPDYQIVVTGHSLGGGAACLLAMLLRCEKQFRNVYCVAFGPPPLVSESLVNVCAGFVVVIANATDVVPQMTIPSLIHVLHICDQARKLVWYKRCLLAFGCDCMVSYTDVCKDLPLAATESAETMRLYVPDMVYHIQEHLSKTPRFTISAADPTFFREIIGDRDMLKDHFPWRYERALRELARAADASRSADDANSRLCG